MPNRRDMLRGGAAAAVAVGAAGVGARGLGERSLDLSAAPRPTPVTALALLLVDRSGSMAIVKDATIQAINDYLDAQRDKPDLLISVIQFDGAALALDITETFGFTPAPECPRLTDTDFMPRGSTPLWAAVASGIARLENVVQSHQKVLMLVQTDGGENASGEVTGDAIKALVKSKEALGNWTFAFMGADIDAWGEADNLGITLGNAMQYNNTRAGTVSAWATTTNSTNTWYTSSNLATAAFYQQNSGVTRAVVIDPGATGAANVYQ